MMQKNWKMTETLARGCLSGSTQFELSNEYQHDKVKVFFKNLCIHVLWMKVALALEGLSFWSITTATNSWTDQTDPELSHSNYITNLNHLNLSNAEATFVQSKRKHLKG